MTNHEEREPLLKVRDVAEMFNVKESWVRSQIKTDPTFPYHRFGRQYRFFRSELIEWEKENTERDKERRFGAIEIL